MKKHILVTGSHRSGTTFVGKVISEPKRIRYIHEPFNIEGNRENCPLKYRNEYVADSSLEHQKEVKKYINSFANLNLGRLGKVKSLKGLYHFLKETKSRFSSSRTVYKDPIAFMSVEWIYKHFDMSVIMLIRHPAAFVSSIKLKNWKFDFNNFLEQEALMNTYLKDYKKIVKEYVETEKDIIDQGILLWNIFHDIIADFQTKYKDEWYFVKHEDLSINPIPEFEKIFNRLGIEYSTEVQNYIIESTTSKVDPDVQKNATKFWDVKRNSKANVEAWKVRLTPEEISRIKEGTKGIWEKFYTENEW